MDRDAIEKTVKSRDSFPVIDFLMSPEGRKHAPYLRAAIVTAIQAPNRPLLDTILDPRLRLDLASALEECNALWLATEAGDMQLMERLLDAGGNANAPGRRGVAPLLAAATVCNLPAARLLLKHGADVQAADEEGRSALHLAAKTGPVDQHEPDTTDLPLSPPGEFAKLLLEYQADVDARDEKGATPLMTAALRGNLEMVQTLLEHAPDVHAADERGNTALHYAALAAIKTVVDSQTEYPTVPTGRIVRLLVARGAHVNHASLQGVTPLHSAAERGNLSAAEALLENGANVRARDVFGMTPLIRAPLAGRITQGRREVMYPQDRSSDLIYVLLEHGADVEARDLDGISALELATELKRRDAIEALLACGANPTLSNNARRTPLQAVMEPGYSLKQE